MRVTNGMIRQNMLQGLNTNMSKLDILYNQMNTLKKVSRPSDNPVITGRALKLRINVLETEQYTSNTKEATSWMETTESALTNVNTILTDIRTRCVQASTDTLDTADRQKILTDMTQLWDQLQQEANVTYAGRHVFSGYKTDQPVMLERAVRLEDDLTLNAEYTLKAGTELKAATELKEGSILSKGTTLNEEITVAQNGDTLEKDTTLNKGTVLASGTKLPKGFVLKAGTTLSAADLTTLKASFPTVTSPLSEDLALESDLVLAGDLTLGGETTLRADLELGGDMKLPSGTTLDNNVKLLNDVTLTVDMTLGEDGRAVVGSVLKKDSVIPEGAVNPVIFNTEAHGKDNISDAQLIEYEIGIGSTISVNTLGMAASMQKIGEDIQEIIDALKYADETGDDTKLNGVFTNKIKDFEESLADISDKKADLGSRSTRLKYTQSRLVDDKTNFTELLSNTEDVDIEETYVEFNAQYMVYQSALQATSKVIMNTLADFLG